MIFIEWFSSYNMVPVGLASKMAIGRTNKFFNKKDNFIEIKRFKIKKFKLNHEQLEALKFLEKKNRKFDVSFYKEPRVQVKL